MCYNAIIMQRKLIKVGTSAAVLIPAEAMKEQRLKIGDLVEIEMAKATAARKKPAVDPEIFEWTEKFRKRYQPLLNKLVSS